MNFRARSAAIAALGLLGAGLALRPLADAVRKTEGPPGGDHRCMTRVSAERVAQAALDLI